MGRNPVFEKEGIVRKNLVAEGHSDKPCVAEANEKVFRFVNYNISKLDKESWFGVGHWTTRKYLLMILRGI
jgi:hypothetical protein